MKEQPTISELRCEALETELRTLYMHLVAAVVQHGGRVVIQRETFEALAADEMPVLDISFSADKRDTVITARL